MPEHVETGMKWWFRYVIVPILGGGGIIAIVVAVIDKPKPIIPAVVSSEVVGGTQMPQPREAPQNPVAVPPQFAGTWTGIRYEMARNNMGYVTVTYVIDKEGMIAIHEQDYSTDQPIRATFRNDLRGLSFSEQLQGDPVGVSHRTQATLGFKGDKVPDKPPRPNGTPCGEPCLRIQVLGNPGEEEIRQEGFLTLRRRAI